MLCLVNRARRTRGLAPLTALKSLNRAADRKSGDILRCDEFSHEACGREFTYWMAHFGYHGCSEGENIAWGSGSLGTPRSIFRAWMHSPGHRENILLRGHRDRPAHGRARRLRRRPRLDRGVRQPLMLTHSNCINLYFCRV